MPTLLIMTYHFPPSAAVGGLRVLGFSRHLPKYGWQTRVVAPPTLPWEGVDQNLQDQVPAETVVDYVPYPHGLLTKPLRVIAPLKIWWMRAWIAGCNAIRLRRPDAILTSGPPHDIHLLGLLLAWSYQIPWVADFRDPWVWTARFDDTFAARNLKATSFLAWRLRRLEQAVIARADAVIANAPRSMEALRTVYPRHAPKMVTITNGYDPEGFRDSAPFQARSDAPIRILHSGQLYAGRDPRPFFDALCEFRSHRPAAARPIQVDFVGYLDVDHRTYQLEDEIQLRGLESTIVVHGQVPYARSLEQMVQSDILLLLDTPGRRIGVLAKAYEYLGAARPILALGEPDSDLAWVLRDSGAPHRIVQPTDTAGIRRALAQLVEDVEAQRSPPDRGLGRLRFTREANAGRLAEVLDRCTARAGLAADRLERTSGRRDHRSPVTGVWPSAS